MRAHAAPCGAMRRHVAPCAQATHDGYIAQDAAASVEEVEVAGGGRRLSCWPPLLSTFSRVTRLVLRGHFMTALPHSVGDMRQLRVRRRSGASQSRRARRPAAEPRTVLAAAARAQPLT